MDPAALASLCLLLARGATAEPLPAGLQCPSAAPAPGRLPVAPGAQPKAPALAAPQAREAITRVAFAEAANQGDSGLAAVVYTILNRIEDGRWGSSVEAVLNAPGQFEPVMRAGGDWRGLRPATAAERARVETILNLALEGRLPDLTNGARFFQNPRIVAAREAAGAVSSGLTNFGGAPPSAVIGAHSFYVEAVKGGGPRRPRNPPAAQGEPPSEDPIFVGRKAAGPSPEPASTQLAESKSTEASGDLTGPPSLEPQRAMFVLPDGRLSDRAR
ncbi:MAG: cell wall hydrolase [Pseudomonadota bacterium]